MPASSSSSRLVPRLEVLLAAALFSTGGAAVKAIALAGWQVASFRSGMATLALLVLMPAARRRPNVRILLVGLAFSATMILFVLSNKLTTAASAIFLQATSPLFVLLLSPWLLGERVRRRDLAYMGVLALGLALFFGGLDPSSSTAPNPLKGDVLAGLSGLTYALAIMGLRGLEREHGGGSGAGAAAALWGSAFTFAVCLPFALPVGPSRPTDWLLLAYLGFFQIALAYVALTRGIGRVPAFEGSLLLLLEPVLNPIWAWLVHGERPGTWSLTGGAVILLATLVKSWLDTQVPPAPAPALVAPP
jgi:drug/metabolite transporter, DME family